MISINEIIFSNYVIGEVYGPIHDVTEHPLRRTSAIRITNSMPWLGYWGPSSVGKLDNGEGILYIDGTLKMQMEHEI